MANNDVQHLLDMLYEMIDGAKNAPLSSDRCILNRDEALDLLDEIRAQLPVELARAQELIRAKEDYVKAAKRDVERMMQQAELDAKAKVSETEVLTAARDRSREIIKRAEDRSREMYRVANEYTEDALRRCRKNARNWHSPLKNKRKYNEKLSKVTKTDKIGRHNLYLDTRKRSRHKILWRLLFVQNKSRTKVSKETRGGRFFAGKSGKSLENAGKFLLAFFM